MSSALKADALPLGNRGGVKKQVSSSAIIINNNNNNNNNEHISRTSFHVKKAQLC